MNPVCKWHLLLGTNNYEILRLCPKCICNKITNETITGNFDEDIFIKSCWMRKVCQALYTNHVSNIEKYVYRKHFVTQKILKCDTSKEKAFLTQLMFHLYITTESKFNDKENTVSFYNDTNFDQYVTLEYC